MREQDILKLTSGRKKISIAEISRRIGKTRATTSAVFNGKGTINFSTFFEILNACNYDIVVKDNKTGELLMPVHKNTPPQDIIKYVLMERRISQTELSRLAGYSSPTNIEGLLGSNKTMYVSSFAKLLGVLDYTVLVIDRTTGEIFADVDIPEIKK